MEKLKPHKAPEVGMSNPRLMLPSDIGLTGVLIWKCTFDNGPEWSGWLDQHPSVICAGSIPAGATIRRALVEESLSSWRSERQTNKHGLAHLADRAIRVLMDDLAQR